MSADTVTFAVLLEQAANVDPEGYRVWYDELAGTLAPQPVTEFVALLSSIAQKLSSISERLDNIDAKITEYEPLIEVVRQRTQGRGSWAGLFKGGATT